MKQYIKPTVDCSKAVVEFVIMASREQSFGNKESDYGNAEWYNEGYAQPTERITGDNGTLDSYSNTGLWDE